MMELKSWSQQNDNNEEDTQVNTLFLCLGYEV